MKINANGFKELNKMVTLASTPVQGKWVIGKKADDTAIMNAWNMDNPKGYLTMEIHKEMLEEAKSLGLKKPMVIWGLVNAGPNGSKSYVFEQFSDRLIDLAVMASLNRLVIMR